MRPSDPIDSAIEQANCEATDATRRQIWQDIARAGNCRPAVSTSERGDIRRFLMRTIATRRIAIAALVLIGVGAITAVGVTVGTIYYWGPSDDGTHHIFYSKGPSGEGFTSMDANGVTAEQAQRDLEEMRSLSQQGKRELLDVKETIIGACRLKTHNYRYQLSDGRTKEMGEPADDMRAYSQDEWKEFSPRLKEFRQLQKAGPGQDLGTSEETVEGRVLSVKRERYVLGDGTEVIWCVGTPKDGR